MIRADRGVQATVHEGLDTLAAFEGEWSELFDRSAVEPSVSFGWTRALVQTLLRDDDRGYVVVLRRGGRLVGIVPLYARRTLLFGQSHRILRPVAELKNTHSDLLLADHSPDLAAAFLEALRLIDYPWDSLRISKLVEGNGLTPALERAAGSMQFIPRRRFRKAAYWIELPHSPGEYLEGRSSKFRNYARRAEKKLRAAGRLEVIEVTTGAEFEAGFAAMLDVERASWKQTHGTAISADARETAFYRAWGREMAEAGGLHLQLLTLNGEPIAHNLGCIHRQTYYYLKTSYAASYRPQSPATFLRLRLIESLIGRGLRAVDFCGTPYEWELQWTHLHRWHHVVSVYADTWRGRLLSRLDRWTHYSSAGKNVEHADPRAQLPSE